MDFEIKFDTQHLSKVLEAARREIATPQEMLGSVGETLLRVTQDRHDKGQAPDGTPWKPLASSTIASKAWAKQGQSFRDARSTSVAAGRKAAGSRLLYVNGDLLRFQYQVSGNQLHLGTNDRKAAWHHYGTGTYGPKGVAYVIRPVNKKALAFAGRVVKRVTHPGIPARPLVGYPESDEKLVGDVLTDHLTAVLRAVR